MLTPVHPPHQRFRRRRSG